MDDPVLHNEAIANGTVTIGRSRPSAGGTYLFPQLMLSQSTAYITIDYYSILGQFNGLFTHKRPEHLKETFQTLNSQVILS